MLYELYHRPHQFLQVLRCALKARVCSNMLTFNPPSKRHPMGLESNKEVDLREKMISLEFTAPKDTCDLELHLQQGVDPSEILKRCDDRFANSLCSGVFPLFLTNVNKQMLPLAGEKVQVESTLLYQYIQYRVLSSQIVYAHGALHSESLTIHGHIFPLLAFSMPPAISKPAAALVRSPSIRPPSWISIWFGLSSVVLLWGE
jgi:hypothetical protein